MRVVAGFHHRLSGAMPPCPQPSLDSIRLHVTAILGACLPTGRQGGAAAGQGRVVVVAAARAALRGQPHAAPPGRTAHGAQGRQGRNAKGEGQAVQALLPRAAARGGLGPVCMRATAGGLASRACPPRHRGWDWDVPVGGPVGVGGPATYLCLSALPRWWWHPRLLSSMQQSVIYHTSLAHTTSQRLAWVAAVQRATATAQLAVQVRWAGAHGRGCRSCLAGEASYVAPGHLACAPPLSPIIGGFCWGHGWCPSVPAPCAYPPVPCPSSSRTWHALSRFAAHADAAVRPGRPMGPHQAPGRTRRRGQHRRRWRLHLHGRDGTGRRSHGSRGSSAAGKRQRQIRSRIPCALQDGGTLRLSHKEAALALCSVCAPSPCLCLPPLQACCAVARSGAVARALARAQSVCPLTQAADDGTPCHACCPRRAASLPSASCPPAAPSSTCWPRPRCPSRPPRRSSRSSPPAPQVCAAVPCRSHGDMVFGWSIWSSWWPYCDCCGLALLSLA